MGNTGGGPGSGSDLEARYFLQKVKLGQGSFGAVWRAVDRKTDEIVAVKQLDKAAMPKRGVTRKDIEREVEMMRACQHENITRFFDSFEDDRSIYLALEYCDGGDFGDKVKERGMGLQESEAADWMAQICSAIQALHRKSVCHRDIKPDNFMVAGVQAGAATLKLADFGLAMFLPRGKLLNDKCGTPAFMAPEQVQLPRSRGYGLPCDVWAAGISMYMLMFGGRHPFISSRGDLNESALVQGALDFREKGDQGFFGGLLGAQSPMRFSEQARRFCTRMVNPNANARVSAEDALRDPWVATAVGRRASRGAVGVTTPAAGGHNFAPQPRQPQQAAPVQGAATPAPGRRGSDPRAEAAAAAQVAQQEKRIQYLTNKVEQQSKDMQKMQHQIASASAPVQPAMGRQATKPLQLRGSGAALSPGTRCRYFSDTYGWMNGTVQSLNEAEGTYNLDVRQHAQADRISPCVDAADVWPIGTSVTYESQQYGGMNGTVTGYNPEDLTYNLDVREHAHPDRIRARLGDKLPAQANDGMRTEKTGDPATGLNGVERAPSPSADAADSEGFAPGGYFPAAPAKEVEVEVMGRLPDFPLPAQHAIDRKKTEAAGAATPGAAAGIRVPDGSSCMVVDAQGGQPQWVKGIIQGYNPDGTFSVLLDPRGQARQMQVRPEGIRAPIGSEAWPPRTMVSYESQSLGTCVPAQVKSFNSQTNSYNLDCRENAAPERVRPR
mmetsp:Transcript_122497/g.215888  ORF Transcript_122497/g.215888 Transcript_122497/m.215888 type:complete len:722 (+) Transcript_122497:169-2334(+)